MSTVLLLAAAAHAQDFAPLPDARWNISSSGYSTHAVGDVDGDGIGDLIWTQTSLALALGTAGGLPQPVPATVPLGGETLATTPVAVADLNADGIDDLFLRVVDGPAIRGWPGAPGGPTGPAWTLGDITGSLVGAGDVNGDGYADLALDTALWLSSPTGPVEGPLLPAASRYSRLSGVGDIDGDGYGDVAGPDLSDVGFGYYSSLEGPLRLYLGGPSGPSAPPLWSRDVMGATGWALTVADVDGDGVQEMIAACLRLVDEQATGALVVFGDLANPAGPTLRTSDPLDFDIGQGFALGNLGDRDGDGTDEVAIGMLGRVRSASWSPGVGFSLAGPAAEEWRSTAGDNIATLQTEDVDGDGLRDLSVLWEDGGNQKTLTLWLGTPPPSPTDTGTAPTDSGTPPVPDTTTTPIDSGASKEETPGPDEPEGCGCASSGAGTSGAALGLLGLLALGRRRPPG